MRVCERVRRVVPVRYFLKKYPPRRFGRRRSTWYLVCFVLILCCFSFSIPIARALWNSSYFVFEFFECRNSDSTTQIIISNHTNNNYNNIIKNINNNNKYHARRTGVNNRQVGQRASAKKFLLYTERDILRCVYRSAKRSVYTNFMFAFLSTGEMVPRWLGPPVDQPISESAGMTLSRGRPRSTVSCRFFYVVSSRFFFTVIFSCYVTIDVYRWVLTRYNTYDFFFLWEKP